MLNLSIGYLINPPDITNDSRRPGIEFEIMQMFCNHSKARCAFRFANDSDDHSFHQNDTFSNLIENLTNGVYDLVLPFLVVTEERLQTLTFSVFHESTYILVTKQPETTTAMTPFGALVFKWSVWLCLAAVSAILGLFVTVAHSDKPGNGFPAFQFFTDFVDMFSFLSDQTSVRKRLISGVKPMVACWGFAVVVVLGVYSGQLVSSTMKNGAKMPFENFETFVDCVELGECVLVVPVEDHHHPNVRKIFSAKFPRFVRLKEALEKNDAFFELIDRSTVYRSILTSSTKNRYVVTMTSYNEYNYHTRGNENCQYMTVGFPGEPVGLPMRKGAPFRRAIGTFAESFRQSGMKDTLNAKYLRKEPVCQLSHFVDEFQSLDSTSFWGYLFVLVFGCFVAVGAFAIELVRFYVKRFNRIKPSVKQMLTRL